MKLSLLITTYNWPRALELTLLSVSRQTVLPDEVVIADDGSTSDTKQMINAIRTNFPVPIIHVWQQDNGYQRTLILNEAIRQASFEYLVQVDGDIILHPHFIKDHKSVSQQGFFIKGSRALLNQQATHQALEAQHTRFGFLSAGLANRLNALRIPFLAPLFFYKDTNSIRGLIGCNMAFWKTDFIAVNGYNNDIVGWGREDSELAVRFINRGIKKKRAKLLSICYHMYHAYVSRDNDARNTAMLNEAMAAGRTTCNNGYQQVNKTIVYK
ncbi:MAG: hypothetical protein RL172_1722 [Bacteroidota bacterium]